jgi:hypothetical protein
MCGLSLLGALLAFQSMMVLVIAISFVRTSRLLTSQMRTILTLMRPDRPGPGK